MEQLIQQLDAGDDEHFNFSTFFKPIKVIGQGAFGKVIQAIDNSTNEELAIKVIHKKKMGDDYIEKVKQESRILEKLNHPNVVEFKKVCETETKILIAMELVQGGSLAQLMKEKKNQKEWFKEKEVSQIMKSIMLGLAYIHGKNIVHRDLKPENILISNVRDFTTLKIADFGLSSAFSLWTTNGLTEQCGTLLYMAPEFFASRTYSKQIDVWSCAIIMHNLLDNGNHPFYNPKSDDTDSFKQKLSNPKWKLPSHFSSLAKNLIQKLSLINPTERYSAIQVLQHPFITENQNGAIPMTMNEQLACFKVKECLIQKVKAIVFLKYVKSLQKKLIEQNQTEDSEQLVDTPTNYALAQSQNLTFNKQLSDVSIDCQDSIRASLLTEPSKISTEESNSTRTISNSIKKPPLNFMIKKQKSLNQEQSQQQFHNRTSKKRNSVLNPRQDYSDNSLLIEIEENPLDQQGSFSEKTFKRQQIVKQLAQKGVSNQQTQNSNPSSQKNIPIITQNTPGSQLTPFQGDRPQVSVIQHNNSAQKKNKPNFINSNPQTQAPAQFNIKKEKNSSGEFCDTVNTPYNKDTEQQGQLNNPQNIFTQLRLKSAQKLKQDSSGVGKRRNSYLNQMSHLQVIKKVVESQDISPNNICSIQDAALMSPKQNQPNQNLYKENRNCVSSLQTQNNSAQKPPLKQYQTQDCIDVTKQCIQQQSVPKQRQIQDLNQLYSRNKIPLRGSDTIYKKQSKSLTREEEKKILQNQSNMHGLPQLSQKEKQMNALVQYIHEAINQDKDPLLKGALKGYLKNTKSRQNHLFSKKLQV